MDEVEQIRVGDIEMAYRSEGSGETLIFIPGAGATMDTYTDLLATLAKGCEVVVLDNRGMGGTTAGSREFTVPQFAEDTAGLMHALSIDRANIAGSSMGGFIAQQLAIRHPQRVRKLVLCCTSCGGEQAVSPNPEVAAHLQELSEADPEKLTEEMTALLFPEEWLKDHEEEAREALSRLEAPDNENVARQKDALAQWTGNYGRLPEITSPTLIVTGAQDKMVPPKNAEILAGRISDSQVVTIDGAGHGLGWQYPKKCAEVILRFLRG